MSDIPKHVQFAAQITSMLADAMQNEDSEHYMEIKEDDLTEFIHALATVAPTMIFNNITGSDKNNLEFNHIANQLCFQFMNNKNKEE